jgi:poly(3-hydroxybutyrate) depolymerase
MFWLRVFAVTVLLCSAVFAAARAGESPAASGDAAAVLRAFFAEPDAARRADLAARFGPVAPKSWTDLKAMLHAAAPRPAIAAGRHPFVTKGDAVLPAIRYMLRVPAGYGDGPARGWPLIITCHGTGGSSEGALASVEGWLGGDIEDYLVAAAEAPDAGKFEPKRTNMEYPLAVLEDLRQRAHVDSDRAFLTGFSKGGYTTWATALFSPGEWAGAVPMACYPMTEAGAAGALLYLANVLRLDVQHHWGAADIEPGQKEGINTLSRDVAAEMKRLGAARFEGVEYPGQGHDVRVSADRFRQFVRTVRRDPFPPECRLIFHHLWQGRDYYVRATAGAKDDFDFRAPHTIRLAAPQPDPRKVKRDYLLSEAFELTARMPAGQNLVAVLARNLREVEVELPAEKLDFSRPLRITLNTRTVHEGVRKLDWVELLETARRTGDFERLIAGRVRAAVPGAK